MTRADFIEELSQAVEMPRKESDIRALRSGDKVEIRGFGSFRTRVRQPRRGRNPKTGAAVDVPGKTIPYFKPSRELKALVLKSGYGSVPTPELSTRNQKA